MGLENGMASDAPKAKQCKCGREPTIFSMERSCQIYCTNHSVVTAANYRVAVGEWNSLATVKGEGDEQTNVLSPE